MARPANQFSQEGNADEVNPVEAAKLKSADEQMAHFKKLASSRTPLTDELVELSKANVANQIRAAAELQLAAADELDAWAEDIEESIKTLHLSARLRNFVSSM